VDRQAKVIRVGGSGYVTVLATPVQERDFVAFTYFGGWAAEIELVTSAGPFLRRLHAADEVEMLAVLEAYWLGYEEARAVAKLEAERATDASSAPRPMAGEAG
jgi:hypothetical protein